MNDSMINPSVLDLLKKTEDRYSLVIISSKRARQIIAGEEGLVKVPSGKPLTTAINELNEGLVHFERPDLDKIKEENEEE